MVYEEKLNSIANPVLAISKRIAPCWIHFLNRMLLTRSEWLQQIYNFRFCYFYIQICSNVIAETPFTPLRRQDMFC